MQHIIFILLLSVNFSAISSTDIESKQTLKAEFKKAYSAYNQALESKKPAEIIVAAEKSYRLGCQHYGQEEINCASLTINYASVINNDADKAVKLFNSALVIYENEYGEDAFELVDVYFLLSKTKGLSRKKQALYLAKVVAIVEPIQKEDPIMAGELLTEVGNRYLAIHSKKSRILTDAYKLLSAHLPENAQTLVKSRFLTAKYYLAKKKYNQATELLEKNIAIVEALDVNHPYELASRAFLVDAYERLDEKDKSTKHCIAIGNMRPWNDNQKQMPLFRRSPKYPVSAARQKKSGWTKMNFSISESGFVTDISVISSSSKVFEKTSIKALKTWRYAPKFEHGKAVVAANLQVQLDYQMTSGKRSLR